MDKRQCGEHDIRTNFIPLAKGRVIVRGKRHSAEVK